MPVARSPETGATAPALDIRRESYAMKIDADGDDAEITMYGDIVEETPRHWWTGEPLEGNYIILGEFIEDLETLKKVKRITIRLNSYGGDAGAAITIHNRLREMEAYITAVVDGVAMSGGSLIMCAADTVRVNPSSLVMIHKCWSLFFGIYNAEELQRSALALDAHDRAQASIYRRKSGIKEKEILRMMSDETYMTGSEAVGKGFADELMDDEEPVSIAASADGRQLYINGAARQLLHPLAKLPEHIPKAESEAEKPALARAAANAESAEAAGRKDGTHMAQTLEELRKENPELAAALMGEAIASATLETGADNSGIIEAERRRIKEIDDISALFDDEIVNEAKYGEKSCTAQEMTYRAALKAAQTGRKFMSDLLEDSARSGANDVPAAPAHDADGYAAGGSDEDPVAAGKAAAALWKEIRGVQ